jgi:hypothetical protein
MPEQDMSLSPANAELLKQAFQQCRDMEGTLSEQLQAYAAAGREIFPAYGEAVDRLVARLRENGGGENAPRPGEPMPPFLLPDETGRLISLPSLLRQGPVAVMFYRGHWCPYCRLNVRAVIQAQDRIKALGAHTVAIMPETQQFTEKWRSGSVPKSSGCCPTRTCRTSTAMRGGCCRSPRPSWSAAMVW